MALMLLAGASALKEIKEHGLSANRIKLIVGASGGPKWLMLSRLDQYINQHFLASATQPISLIGSSIGAWRMALYAQKNPEQVFKEFETAYLEQQYPKPLKPKDITVFVNEILAIFFSGKRAKHVVENAKRKLHVVAVRNRKIFNGSHNAVQILNLLTAATGNILSSKIVEALYPRVLISQDESFEPYEKKPELIKLTENNLGQSLAASGAIPMVLEPTKIEGGKDRWHWDGGTVDYHFSGPFNIDDGLVFYPHFFPKVIPGWFDKALPWRKIKAKNYDNVVMLTPDKEFIASLPYGKIPDRKDFVELSDEDRLAYWNTVLAATDKLVEEFHAMLEKDGGASAVQPIEKIL